MNTRHLEGKVAIVTGAAGGIGREFVRGLLGAGARVAALDVDEDGLAALAVTHDEALGAGRLVTEHADISRYEECEAAVAKTRESLGGLHVLVNNGAVGMGVIRMDHMTNLIEIHEIAPDVWDRFVAVNLSGAWYLTRAAIEGLLDQGWGRIVNVTTSFFTMLRGKFHPYSPPKAGLEAMSAGHAKEFAGRGVTVNVVVPGGPADTPMVPGGVGHRPRRDGPPVGDGAARPLALLRGGGAWTGHRYIAGELGRVARARGGGRALPRPDRMGGPRPDPRSGRGASHPSNPAPVPCASDGRAPRGERARRPRHGSRGRRRSAG